MSNISKPVYFKTASDFRKWLMENHDKAPELLVGYYKTHTGKPSLTWTESVDQALCFGWIDGLRKSIDEERYFIRFTPRKKTSIWSAINIKKVEELQAKGLMHPLGMRAFEARQENKSRIYAYEKEPAVLSEELEKIFKSNKKAWQVFSKMAPSYKRSAIHWVVSAKSESTRMKRLNELINDSENERKIKPLSY